jgi:hypothetical protein
LPRINLFMSHQNFQGRRGGWSYSSTHIHLQH